VKDEYIRDQGPQQAELLEKKKKSFKKSKCQVLIRKVKVMDPKPSQVVTAGPLRCLQLCNRSG